MLRTRLIFIAGLIAVVLFSTALAQTFRGGVSGIITDQTGANVAGATVQLTSDAET